MKSHILLATALFICACQVSTGGGSGSSGGGNGGDGQKNDENSLPALTDERPKGGPRSITNEFHYFHCFSKDDAYSKMLPSQTIEVNGQEGYSNIWKFLIVEHADGNLWSYQQVGEAEQTNSTFHSTYKRADSTIEISINLDTKENSLQVDGKKVELESCDRNDPHPFRDLQVEKRKALVRNPWCKESGFYGDKDLRYVFHAGGRVDRKTEGQESRGTWQTFRDELMLKFPEGETRVTDYFLSWGELTIWEPDYGKFKKCEAGN